MRSNVGGAEAGVGGDGDERHRAAEGVSAIQVRRERPMADVARGVAEGEVPEPPDAESETGQRETTGAGVLGS